MAYTAGNPSSNAEVGFWLTPIGEANAARETPMAKEKRRGNAIVRIISITTMAAAIRCIGVSGSYSVSGHIRHFFIASR